MTEPSATIAVMLGNTYDLQDCSLARALESLGERWTLLIVRDAFFGVRRFSDFQAHLDVPRAVLSNRLTGLVRDGILVRRADEERPGRHVYELTDAGRDLWPVLYSLLVWGGRHRLPNSRTFEHAACGVPLDDRGACPACSTTPPPQDIVIKPKRGRARQRKDPVAVALRKPHRLLLPLAT
jgi:DNA-binding HxlR family transcriptional regulator